MQKQIIILFLLLVLINTSCFGKDEATRSSISDEFSRLVLSGEKHKELNDLANALLSYQKAISLEPNNARGHMGVAKIYARMKEYENAVREFEIAMVLDNNLELLILPSLIVIHILKNNVDKFKVCLHKIKTKDHSLYGTITQQVIIARTFGLLETETGFIMEVKFPGVPSIEYQELSNTAYSYQQNYEIEKAIQILQSFIDKEEVSVIDKAMAYNELGMLSYQYINPIIGIENLEKATDIFPNYLYWRQQLTLVLIYTQLYTKALEETKKIQQLEPNNKFILLAKGIIYNEFGNYNKTVKVLNDLKNKDEFLFSLVEDIYENAINRPKN